MTGFQGVINQYPAPAVEGDFASANPRSTVLAGEGSLVAGAGGVTVGRFAWVDTTDNKTTYSRGTYPQAPNGFVHREQQALITSWLGQTSKTVPEGMPVTLFNQGDFWAVVGGSTAATVGAAVYATYADGSITIGSASASASSTASIGATTTASIGATFTASADTDDTKLVVTSVTGLISVGDELDGTGITAGTTVISQVSGTPGGAGTYQLSASNTASSATVTAFGDVLKVTAVTGLLSVGDTVSSPSGATITEQLTGSTGGTGTYRLSAPATAYTASGTITAFGSVLHVTAVGSGALAVGMPVSGTGVPTGAVISAQLDGTAGGAGNYSLSVAATAYAASTTVTGAGGVLTSFKCASEAAVGELVKISTWN